MNRKAKERKGAKGLLHMHEDRFPVFRRLEGDWRATGGRLEGDWRAN